MSAASVAWNHTGSRVTEFLIQQLGCIALSRIEDEQRSTTIERKIFEATHEQLANASSSGRAVHEQSLNFPAMQGVCLRRELELNGADEPRVVQRGKQETSPLFDVTRDGEPVFARRRG